MFSWRDLVYAAILILSGLFLDEEGMIGGSWFFQYGAIPIALVLACLVVEYNIAGRRAVLWLWAKLLGLSLAMFLLAYVFPRKQIDEAEYESPTHRMWDAVLSGAIPLDQVRDEDLRPESESARQRREYRRMGALLNPLQKHLVITGALFLYFLTLGLWDWGPVLVDNVKGWLGL